MKEDQWRIKEKPSPKEQNTTAPEGWSSDSHITNFILQHGCGRLFHVDDKNGLFRRQDLLGMNWFGLPQFMAAATAAAATHRHTTSKAKPQAPPEAARSEPPAPKASSQAHSRRSRSRSVSVSRSRSAPITVAAKRDMTGQWKDLTAEKVSKLLATQSVELLLFAAQKENLFRPASCFRLRFYSVDMLFFFPLCLALCSLVACYDIGASAHGLPTCSNFPNDFPVSELQLWIPSLLFQQERKPDARVGEEYHRLHRWLCGGSLSTAGWQKSSSGGNDTAFVLLQTALVSNKTGRDSDARLLKIIRI